MKTNYQLSLSRVGRWNDCYRWSKRRSTEILFVLQDSLSWSIVVKNIRFETDASTSTQIQLSESLLSQMACSFPSSSEIKASSCILRRINHTWSDHAPRPLPTPKLRISSFFNRAKSRDIVFELLNLKSRTFSKAAESLANQHAHPNPPMDPLEIAIGETKALLQPLFTKPTLSTKLLEKPPFRWVELQFPLFMHN